MATQTIEIRAVDKTRNTLGAINTRLGNIDKNSKNISTSFGRIAALAGSVFAGLGLANVARGIVNVSRRFEDLRAQLKTVTGSVELASVAFGEIQKFAATTPFTVDEITDSFVILKRFGIDATIPSLKAFGNIAAANNRTFTQFAEAIADALTGEYERLKEFGIKVSSENGKFVARLGDQQLGVANSSTELIEIIRKLGEEGGRFGTGIEDRARTLSGALSNLKDSSDAVADAIGEAGINAALGDLAKTLGDGLRAAIPFAETIGQQLGQAIFEFSRFLRESTFDMGKFIQGAKIAAAVLGGAGLVKIVGLAAAAFVKLGLAIKGITRRTALGLLLTGVASLITYLSMENGLGRTIAQVTAVMDKLGHIAGGVAKFFKDSLGKVMEYLTGIFDKFVEGVVSGYNAIAQFIPFLDEVEVTGREVRESLKNLAVDGYETVKTAVGEVIDATAEYIDQNELIQNALAEGKGIIDSLTESWVAAGLSYDEASAKSKQLYLETLGLNKETKELGDNTEKVNEAMGGGSKDVETFTNAQKKLGEQLIKNANALSQYGLAKQREDLEKGKAYAIKQLEEEYKDKEGMLVEFNERKKEIEDAFNKEIEKLTEDSLKKQDDAYMASIEKRLKASQSGIANVLSEKDKEFLQRKGQEERQAGVVKDRIEFEKKSELEKVQFGLSQGKKLFEGLGRYSKQAFAAMKAFAIAEAIINTYQGATKALASYAPPYNFIAAAAVVASGFAQVSAIRAQQPVGAQRGGDLQTGRQTVVGEDGPELIVPKQPSTVIPNEVATALEGMSGGRGEVNVNFNISTVDASDFDQLLVERRGTIVGIISQAMERRGKQGVV